MSYAIRAGFALTAIAAVVVPAAAQSNPYRQVEARTGAPARHECRRMGGVDRGRSGSPRQRLGATSML